MSVWILVRVYCDAPGCSEHYNTEGGAYSSFMGVLTIEPIKKLPEGWQLYKPVEYYGNVEKIYCPKHKR